MKKKTYTVSGGANARRFHQGGNSIEGDWNQLAVAPTYGTPQQITTHNEKKEEKLHTAVAGVPT